MSQTTKNQANDKLQDTPRIERLIALAERLIVALTDPDDRGGGGDEPPGRRKRPAETLPA